MINYKDTLNILQTNFEMKANLPKKEPIFQKYWLDHKIYEKILAKNKQKPQWILHDGPPYANGNIHLGHALDKILKDIIVRYKNMKGFYSEYIPGWDTHGLPIEQALLKQGINTQKDLTILQKRKNCEVFAIKNVQLQKTQFERLGLLTDFKKFYMTLDRDYQVRQLELFLKIIQEKLIYQDFKPVYWSWASLTALADAEIEYQDVKSSSIFVSFLISENKKNFNKGDKLLIWTTTPWTIPSNLAIAVHPNLTYLKVSVENEKYVIAESLLDKVANKLNWRNYQIISKFKGTELEYLKYINPWNEKESYVILADYVSAEDGTGLVHNAPGFGLDDYLACKKYNIPIFCPIDQHGKFTSEVNDSDLIGVFYDDANKIITKRLQTKNALLSLEFITHSAAHDWRSKKPVIYRATKQWFINVQSISDDLLKSIEKVKFINEINRKQLYDKIKNRGEWCISRQRIWGVPIPIIYDDQDQPILDYDLIKNIIEKIKESGPDIWFDKPVEYFLTNKYLKKDYSKYRKETDIVDVWFDSGSSFTLLEANHLSYPADLYFEGNDQYRGWFNSSLINSYIYAKKAPFKSLLSHGFVLDEQNRKMSKSLGNVIDPITVCNELGADILRLWAANSNFQEDVTVSKNILNQTSEIYRRLRNTLFKFILSNISDFSFKKDQCHEYLKIDYLILNNLSNNLKKINDCYEKFDFNTIIKIINNHVIELSSWYFDIIKDALYCFKKTDKRRRTIQTILYLILQTYLILLSPILPHTCEEVYQSISNDEKQESIFLTDWISELPLSLKQINLDSWDRFFDVKNAVFLKLEEARNQKIITKNNQATVEIEVKNFNDFNENELAKYLNVAKVKLISSKKDDLKIKVKVDPLQKCLRCWNYYDINEMHDENICNRCHEVIK